MFVQFASVIPPPASCSLECCFVAQGSSQSMGEGRQTSDYIFTIAHFMQLDQEWKHGLVFLKLDVEKAFDALNRQVFLERLADKLGCNQVLQCWWSMFGSTDAVLSTVWGQSVIDMVTGIRQGSVGITSNVCRSDRLGSARCG